MSDTTSLAIICKHYWIVDKHNYGICKLCGRGRQFVSHIRFQPISKKFGRLISELNMDAFVAASITYEGERRYRSGRN